MPGSFEEFRQTVRQLRRSPSFALTALLTLTLAICANVVVYGVVENLILRPLPVPQPQQLVQLQGKGMFNNNVSYPNYRDLQAGTGSFQQLALARLARVSMVSGNTAIPVWGWVASGNYFQAMGVQPQLGRFFTPADDVTSNGSPVLVLSDELWRNQFQADPSVVGRIVRIAKHPYTIIGVASPGFFGTERILHPGVWIPFHQGPELDGYNAFESRGSTSSWAVGRLRPGVTRATADADLRRVCAQLARQFPDNDATLQLHTVTPGLIGDTLGKPVRAFLVGLLLLAGLVLLAACANLGVLFSARTADRARELGIRLAIGSSRTRILRQLLTESVLLALTAGVMASLLSSVLLRSLERGEPAMDLPIGFALSVDWSMYLVGTLLALATGMIFGMVPARQIWKTDPSATMRGTAMPGSASARSVLRSSLLFVQIALCCLMITASFVSLRGLERTLHLPVGFDAHGVTVATLDVHLAGYEGADQAVEEQRLLHAAAAIPGVTSAAYTNKLQLSGSSNSNTIYAPGTTQFDVAHVRTDATVYAVSSGYFHTAGTRLLEGRDFSDADTASSPAVAVVDRSLAQQVFGTTHVVGKRLLTGMNMSSEIVGVVEAGKYNTLTEGDQTAYFRPMAQDADSQIALLVRSDRPKAEMVAALRQAVVAQDSNIPLFHVAPWQDELGLVMFPARAATFALGVLGSLALLLAVTGIFGVASYTVANRMREFGIRVALGGGAAHVVRAALSRVALLLAGGSVTGLLLGVAATRLLAAVVVDANGRDPLVLAGVALTMLAIGLVSTALPTRRALRVQPAELLREQ